MLVEFSVLYSTFNNRGSQQIAIVCPFLFIDAHFIKCSYNVVRWWLCGEWEGVRVWGALVGGRDLCAAWVIR